MKILLWFLFNMAFGTDFSLVDEKFIFSGPNCHNTALRAVGAMESTRYIREDEMTSILNRFCQKTAKRDGAMGVIKVGELERPMHAFVNLENDMVLTKDGVSKRAGVEIVPFKTMYGTHKRAIEMDCRRREVSPAECQIDIQYYQCQTIDSLAVEKVVSTLYDKREKFFQSEYHLNIIDALNEDRERKGDHCLAYRSIVQSLEIANWNSRGPIEYETLNQFIDQVKSEFDHQFCLN